jgi:ABC-type polysaccharide/polyol phosphate export permease
MRLHAAINDLKKGAFHYRTWLYLGWTEVKQRYRRSVIGPWWISLSMLIFIMAMGIVFSRLFHQNLDEYIPFFTAGYLFWSFISSSINESTEVFKSNEGFIKQINLPFSLYVFKHMVRQVICLMHNLVIYVLICFFFQLNPRWTILLIFPAFLLLAMNMYWICFLIGMICTRFRDMIPIVTSCMQIAFFVTPISWTPKLLDQNSSILKLNPLAYLIDIVRAPLLGEFPSLTSWYVAISLLISGSIFTLFLFSRTRTRLAFWVD